MGGYATGFPDECHALDAMEHRDPVCAAWPTCRRMRESPTIGCTRDALWFKQKDAKCGTGVRNATVAECLQKLVMAGSSGPGQIYGNPAMEKEKK